MNEMTKPQEWYRTNFESFEKSLNGESGFPIHQLRKQAITRFVETGFPDQNDEEWRFTNISPIAKTHFQPILADRNFTVTKDELKPFITGDGKILFVFVNGKFSSEHSSVENLPKGMTIVNLSAVSNDKSSKSHQYLGTLAKSEDSAFNALNASFMKEGIFIQLDDGVVCETPVQILFVSTSHDKPFSVHPRNLIIAGKNSEISIIETYAGISDNVYFTNVVTEIYLHPDARVQLTKLVFESDNAYHIGTTEIYQHIKSNFTSNAINLSGAIIRNNLSSKLDDEWIECTFNGLSLSTGDQLIDNHTTIDHAKPNCQSHELYKAILDQKSRGVFNGKIFVRQDAQKTDAKQTNKALLLSDLATIDTKPQLEIFADDVKCTHGATVGQLDANQIFYLRSRGFGGDQARDVLTNAFANDLIDRINNQALKDRLHDLIFRRLHEGRTAGDE